MHSPKDTCVAVLVREVFPEVVKWWSVGSVTFCKAGICRLLSIDSCFDQISKFPRQRVTVIKGLESGNGLSRSQAESVLLMKEQPCVYETPSSANPSRSLHRERWSLTSKHSPDSV